MSSYSIVIPVYRGEKTIRSLFDGIRNFFESRQLKFEVVFVFDCGPDKSWEIISELKRIHGESVQGIKLSRNFGQHNATICGFKYAKGDFIITMDEDLQHRPDDIELLISKQAETNGDVIYGYYDERRHSFFRNFTSYLLNRLLALGIPGLHRHYTSFRLVRTEIAKETLRMNNSYTFLDGYITWITSNVHSVKVNHQHGQAGKSSYSLIKLVEHSINIFVTFSNLPIRILSMLSLLVLLSSVIYTIYIIIRKVFYDDLVQGYSSYIIISGLGIGFILFGLGVIGEYIQRINLKTTQRPNYIVRDII